jgi:translation initiation factor IF-3
MPPDKLIVVCELHMMMADDMSSAIQKHDWWHKCKESEKWFTDDTSAKWALEQGGKLVKRTHLDTTTYMQHMHLVISLPADLATEYFLRFTN